MDITHAYIYLAIAGILAVGFLGMIIYGVVLYFRGRKMGVDKIRRPVGRVNRVVDMDDDMDEHRLFRDSINGDLGDAAYWF